MPYRIAGIDVHKKMLAVVIADVAVQGEYEYEQRRFGTTESELRSLTEWLRERQVHECVMESTAQYWRPVWSMLEQHWSPFIMQCEDAGPMTGKLHLAQAYSNRAARGRKNDFRDAERLVRRLAAQELVLSFVPDPEQRLWRTLTRRRAGLRDDRGRLQNGLEALLEQMHIKLSSMVSDLLGVSGRRMLEAIACGADQPAEIAALADKALRASQEKLCDALESCRNLRPQYRKLLKMELERLALLDKQIAELEQEIAAVLRPHSDAVQRVAEVPGLGVESAQQIIAEVGPAAAVFSTQKSLPSWVGAIPGEDVSAGKSHGTASPKGNKTMRSILNQAAHAAVQMKGCIFEVVFRRLVSRMEYKEAIWCIAHRICRIVWKILHQNIRYEERGPSVSVKARKDRFKKMIRKLKKAGYQILEPAVIPA